MTTENWPLAGDLPRLVIYEGKQNAAAAFWVGLSCLEVWQEFFPNCVGEDVKIKIERIATHTAAQPQGDKNGY